MNNNIDNMKMILCNNTLFIINNYFIFPINNCQNKIIVKIKIIMVAYYGAKSRRIIHSK